MLHEGTEKNLLCWCDLATFLGNKIVIIDMYICIHDLLELSLECNCVVLVVYELFISAPKSQVYGILHDVHSKEELKDTGTVLFEYSIFHVYR